MIVLTYCKQSWPNLLNRNFSSAWETVLCRVELERETSVHCFCLKMNQEKKKRGENWSSEEKEILWQLIGKSGHILEDKSTKTNINMLKVKEWRNVTIKLNELTGKNRSESEIKLAWKRMKMRAKTNISAHRQAQMRTGGGEKPPSPSPEDLAVMAITPHDFVVEINDYDSDAVLIPLTTTQPHEDIVIAKPSCSYSQKQIENSESINITSECNTEQVIYEINSDEGNKGGKGKRANKGTIKRKETTRESIIESNIVFKKRHLELLEIEHSYNIEISILQIKKLKLEIDLLQTKKQPKET